VYQEGVDTSLPTTATVNVSFKVEENQDYLNASIGYSGSFGFSVPSSYAYDFSKRSHLNGAGQVPALTGIGVGSYTDFFISFTEPWFMNTPLCRFDVFVQDTVHI